MKTSVFIITREIRSTGFFQTTGIQLNDLDRAIKRVKGLHGNMKVMEYSYVSGKLLSVTERFTLKR